MTPSHSLLKESLNLLGWNLLRKVLAGYSYSPASQGLLKNLQPENDYHSAKAALEETEEMTTILESGSSFPMESFEDIESILEESGRSGILELKQLLNVSRFLKLAQSIRNFFQKCHDSPRLKNLAARIDALAPLRDEYSRCINNEGEIRENATPELKQAVCSVRSAREELEKEIEKLMSNPSVREGLQDAYFTEREGRFVLPVKAEHQSKVEGFVHDTSGSGSTLFIEPSKIVPLNNQLKINRIRADREKVRIRRQLVESLNKHQVEVRIDLEVLVTFDLIHSRASLGKAMNANRFIFVSENRVNLKQARNPELILNGSNVVPNDIFWPSGTDAVIISGPNTGGKTITLKTVGLMALMARAGLLLPADEQSEIGFFPEIYADIGDDQNIQRSLSTFSGHLDKVIHMLNNAKPGSLVLLDELGIATDPAQGSSLAEAILLEFQSKGMTTLVSTHYLSLKVLAQVQEGFLNACMEFDESTRTPTYRLTFGTPGASAAIETARRLGLDPAIIQKAHEIYKRQDTRAESILQSLNQQKLELARERDLLENNKIQIDRLKAEQEAITVELREDKRSFRKEKARKLQTAIRETRSQIRSMINKIKGTSDLEKIRKTEKKINAIGQALHTEDAPDLSEWDLSPEKLKEGDVVVVDGYTAKGRLLENPKGKKKVRVKLGNLETRLEIKRLKGSSRLPKVPVVRNAERPSITLESSFEPKPQFSCDLRGMRLEEAKKVLEAFIDKALINKMGKVKIIHGHGTGTVKSFVRDYLESCSIGKSFASGRREEGGDGVTIIEL